MRESGKLKRWDYIMSTIKLTLLASGFIFIMGLGMQPASKADAENKIYFPGSETDFLKSDDLSWEKIPQHYVPSKGIKDWQKLHSELHWKKGASAYELAHSWENANPDLPPEIQSLFYGPVELLAATPEHKTPLRGRGAASQTDVLAFIGIRDRVCAVAVEGKVDEGFNKTIEKWSTNASANAKKRLEFLSDTLGIKPADKLPYQLFHRTAAAVLEARHFKADCAAMIVQSFSSAQTSFDDFAEFINVFGIDSVKPNKLYKTDKAGIDLYVGWADSPNSTLVTTAPPAIPAPKESSGILKTYMKYKTGVNSILMLMLIVLLFYFMWWYTRKNSSSMGKADQKVEGVPTETGARSKLTGSMEKAVAKSSEMKSIDKVKGDAFEEYVVDKFDMLTEGDKKKPFLNKHGRFILIDWRGDKGEGGVFPEKNKYPDLEIGCFLYQDKNPHKFAVDCKFRGDYYHGKIKICKTQTLKNYKEYEQKEGLKTFIVLGVGGYPDNPEDMFIIPLERLKIVDTELTVEQLAFYREPGKRKSFYYDCNKKKLKFN